MVWNAQAQVILKQKEVSLRSVWEEFFWDPSFKNYEFCVASP